VFLEEFHVGAETLTAPRTVTEADVMAFAQLSGDYNPLHTDEAFAATTPFKGRVAHGALVLSIATGLISGTGQLDGTALAFLGIEGWKFIGPVRFGDAVRVRMTVLEARPSSSRPDAGVLKRRIEVLNQRD
jgi:acyl dehydratase